VVGEVDLLRAQGDPHRQGDCVALLLRPNPITVPLDMDVEVASDLLTGTPIRSLPVVEDERLVGVVSRCDVLRALSRRVRG